MRGRRGSLSWGKKELAHFGSSLENDNFCSGRSRDRNLSSTFYESSGTENHNNIGESPKKLRKQTCELRPFLPSLPFPFSFQPRPTSSPSLFYLSLPKMSNPNAISIEPTAKPSKPSSSNKRKGAPTGPPQIRTTNDDGSLAPVQTASSSGGDPAAKKQKKFFKHRLPEEERPEKEEKEVGVSKLKAGLRQAKRFLAKVSSSLRS